MKRFLFHYFRIFWPIGLLVLPAGLAHAFSIVRSTALRAAERAVNNQVIDTANGFLYVTTDASIFNKDGQLIKIRLADFSRVGSAALSDGYNGRALFIDQAGGYVYTAQELVGAPTPTNITRTRLSDLSHVDTLVLPNGDSGVYSAGVDQTRGFGYLTVWYHTGSGAGPRIEKIRLSDFSLAGSLDLGASVSSVFGGLMDEAAGYIYFLPDTGASPAKVIRVRLSDFAVDQTLTLNPGETSIRTADIDTANGFIYLGTTSKMIKVRLSDFTRVGSFPLPAGPPVLTAQFDFTHGYLILGYSGTPARLTRLRLTDFTPIDSLILQAGDDPLVTSAIDPAHGYAYEGTSTNPGRIVKIRLSDFSRADALTFYRGEDGPGSIVVDSARGHVLFGANDDNDDSDDPGQIVELQTSDLSRLNGISLPRSSGYLQDAFLDPTQPDATFSSWYGGGTNKQTVVQIDRVNFTVTNSTLYPGLDMESSALDAVHHRAYLGDYHGVLGEYDLATHSYSRQKQLVPTDHSLDEIALDAAGDTAYILSGSQILRVRLADLTITGTINLGAQDYVDTIAVDSAGGYLYYSLEGAAASVIKVSLASLTPTATLTIAGETGYLNSSFIDASNHYLYLGTRPKDYPDDLGPGRVYQIRLADFSQTGKLPFAANQTGVETVAYDPIGKMAYFATVKPGSIIQVDVSDGAGQTPIDQAPTIAQAAAASPSPVTGTTSTLSVLGADSDNAEATLTYTWTSGTPGVTFSLNGNHDAQQTTATFPAPGSYTLTATVADPAGKTATSQVVVTVIQTLKRLIVSPSSIGVTVGKTASFSVQAKDQFDALMTNTPTITWSVPSAAGTINASGVFTAAIFAGGPFTVTADAGQVSGTAAVTVTSDVVPAITTVTATPNPVTGTTSTLNVTATDNDDGEPALTYIWSGPAGVTFSANNSNGAKQTIATFSAVGSYTLQVRAQDPSGESASATIVVQVNQTLKAVVLTPASATLRSGEQQLFTAAQNDQFGNPVATPGTVVWSATSGVIFSGLYTAGTTLGIATITATVGSVSATAAVTVVDDAPPTITVAASSLVNPVTGKTDVMTVSASDPDDQEPTLTYTWSGAANVSFDPNGNNLAKTTTATFAAAGSYPLTVTVKDPAGKTTSSNVTIVVNQTLTGVTVSPATIGVEIGKSTAFSVSGVDQFGAPMSTLPLIAWTVSGGGSIDSAGLFTAGQTPGGPFDVTATVGSLTNTGHVTVTANAPPTIAEAASATSNPVTAKTAALRVRGASEVGEALLTYSWTGPAGITFSPNNSHAARDSIATFTAPGTFTLTAQVADPSGASVPSSVIVVVNATPTTLTVSPSPATVRVGRTRAFFATVENQFGADILSPSVQWSTTAGGVIDASGVFTAGLTPRAVTVTAHSGGLSEDVSLTITQTFPRRSQPVLSRCPRR